MSVCQWDEFFMKKKKTDWVPQKLSSNQRLNRFISFLKQAATEKGCFFPYESPIPSSSCYFFSAHISAGFLQLSTASQNAMKQPPWLLVKPCRCQSARSWQEIERLGLDSDSLNTIYLENIEGRKSNEDKYSDSEEQMWVSVWGTTEFLRAVLVVSVKSAA